MGFLYQLTSPSGKSYIGVTSKTVEERWRTHVNDAPHCDRAVHRAIRKYGADTFEVRTLAEAEMGYLWDLEPKAIAALGTLAPNGYNMAEGGEGSCGRGSRPAQSQAMKRVWARTGHREKVSAAISDAKIGKALSESHKSALSTGAKRRWSRGVPDEHREAARRNALEMWRERRGE